MPTRLGIFVTYAMPNWNIMRRTERYISPNLVGEVRSYPLVENDAGSASS